MCVCSVLLVQTIYIQDWQSCHMTGKHGKVWEFSIGPKRWRILLELLSINFIYVNSKYNVLIL